ncbi:MAG: DUF1648 domain-containing protein [Geothrix sp.]|uniref:DUF5808 domain-containing protein n=1 Tax=Geothrix sp. TaxID=1962974 RepID=UPI00182FC278|nr:DUF5808 domain-containing protein [Geothrix sp.]NWJ40141.1 DUF1648 domain-containing protein [Geothrix sp.]WIL21850.1 MAG: DUF5808 domain-containing protein [Geothrix sp.]
MEPDDPSPIPWFSPWDLLPLLSALSLALALPRLMAGLPDPIPTHFDARGVPNGWTPQAGYPWLAFGLPAAIWAVLWLTGRAFVGSNQDPEGRKCAALAPLRSLVTVGLLGMMAGGLLIPRHGQGVIAWMIGGFLALTILGILLMVRQMKQTLQEDERSEYYRWGVFYVNAGDPAIWVPKRLGLGWTLNFAHGLSWAILTLLLLPVLLLIAFARPH